MTQVPGHLGHATGPTSGAWSTPKQSLDLARLIRATVQPLPSLREARPNDAGVAFQRRLR